ncbi:D-Ala-D-Ala carboxypeptidase family metallohydrolase [Flavobacteriaceae bacterium]|nr:D-Ala-D-Ala carboxypeptidase family metallohydrolase [Flavobacteriaceae bacterium]
MGDLTKNLSRHEFNSSDGRCIAVDFELVNALQDVTDAFARMSGRRVGIRITSPYRSPEVNARTPNASNKSYHLKGMAADFHLYFKDNGRRINPRLVYDYLDKRYAGKFGVSLYINRVHFDVRKQPWRSPEVTK